MCLAQGPQCNEAGEECMVDEIDTSKDCPLMGSNRYVLSKTYTVNPLYNDTVCHQISCVKLNFCCNEFKFKLNWYICANTIDVV